MSEAATVIDVDAGEPASRPDRGASRPTRRGGLGAGALTSLGLQGAGTVLQYATQVVLARALGVNQFGVYTYSLTWGRIAGSLSHLGGANSGLRFVPEYATSQRWSLLHGVVRQFRLIALVVGSCVAGVGAWLVLVHAGSHAQSLALGLAIVPLAALVELDVALIRACKRVFRAFFPWLVLQPLILLVVVAIPLVRGDELQAEAAVVATIGSYLACLILQEVWLRASTPPEARTAEPTYAAREWSRVTVPIFLTNVVQIVFSRLDIVMVGLLLSPRQAGIYAVALKVGGLASILQTAMNATVAPRISQLYWSGQSDELRRLVLTSIRWTWVPTVAITAMLAVFSQQILTLFGNGFAVGSGVLILIALGQLVSVSSGPVGWLMNLTGHERLAATVFTITAALTFTAYFVLIPWLGLAGAALANGGAVAVRNVALNVAARRRLGLHISVLRSIKERSA